MREFKIVQMSNTGALVTNYEMFSTIETAVAWGDTQNKENPGSVVDIEPMDSNEEMKYEY